MTGNPVVTLNKAVAVAMADGPDAGLAMLDTVDERLNGNYRVDAVRAHLYEMAGDTDPRWTTTGRRRAARSTFPNSAT